MSVPVTIEELPEQIGRFGPSPYCADARPRANSVTVRRHRSLLMAGARRRTADNVEDNDAVVLLWPAPEDGGHALIVDGRGATHHDPVHDTVVLIQPGKAVLHVTGRGG